MDRRLFRFQKTLFSSLLILAVFFPGCSRLPVTSALPEGIAITRVAECDLDSPLAWHPAGEQIAFSAKGLALYDLQTAEKETLSAGKPTALSWSADGRQLAAGFRQGDHSTVELHSRGGQVSNQLTINGHIRYLDWLSDGAILIATAEVEKAAYGITLRTGFTRWDGKGAPIYEPARSVTLTPQDRPDIEEFLRNTFHVFVSPAKNKLLYTKLITPPLGRSWVKYILKDLATGQETETATAFPASGGGLLLQNGQVLLYGDGEFSTRAIDLATGEQFFSLFTPGRSLAASADGRFWFIDGSLLKDKEIFLSFTAESRAIFSPAGDALLLKKDNGLFLVSGLAGK